METTKSENELIAEFMGFTCDNTHGWYEGPRKEGVITAGFNNVFAFRVQDAAFYTSWDWLMPVVEKIESVIREDSSYLLETCGKVNENEEDIKKWREWQNRKIKLRTSIEGVYGDVVEFIKWYNQQTVTPKE